MPTFELLPATTVDTDLKDAWRSLAEVSAHPSFLLTWPAVRTWLALQKEPSEIQLLIGRQDGEVALACLLGSSRFTRHKVFRGRSLCLNSSMPAGADLVHIEYNDVLLNQDADSVALITGMLEFLREHWPGKWDELYLPGLAEGSHLLSYLARTPPEGFVIEVDSDTVSPYVDLDEIRASGSDYLETLSSNTRQQLRRSLRSYEKKGVLHLEVAVTESTALEMFEELCELHQGSWTARGQPGSFARRDVRQYHRELISACFLSGHIQMLRVRCDEATVGCLYSFVDRGHVHFYSSGLAYEKDKRMRPGWVAHYLAIKHNLELGHNVYDFLAGPSRYKTSFSNHTRRMLWCRLQRNRLRFRVERKIRYWKRSFTDRRVAS